MEFFRLYLRLRPFGGRCDRRVQSQQLFAVQIEMPSKSTQEAAHENRRGQCGVIITFQRGEDVFANLGRVGNCLNCQSLRVATLAQTFS
jgi:hypothetical protein